MNLPARLRRLPPWGPWVFVAMFLVVFAANGVLALFAFGTWTGLATEDAYRKGLAYNRTLEAARDQAATGWRVEVDFVPKDRGRAWIGARIRDRDGRAVKASAVTAELVRPTHGGHDMTVALPEVGAGRYGAEIALPLPGQWDLRVFAEHAGGVHQAARRVVARP